MSLLTLGDQVLEAVRKRSSKVQAEAYLVHSESRTQEWSEGQPENLAVSQGQGIGLRVIDNGRLGFGSTNTSDAASLGWLAESAVKAAEVTAPDPLLELPKPVSVRPEAELELVDSSLASGSFEERSHFLATMESEVKKRDKRLTKVLRASYREGRYESAVVNSLGVSGHSAGTSVSFTLACVAVEGNETQVGYGFQALRHYADLKPDWVIEKTVENTLSLLGGKQVPSGRYDLLLDPFVAAEMLELVSHALRADQVLKGRSFLAQAVGKEVGASCLTIVDDGRLKRGLGTSAYDAEGLPTQTTVLFKEGVLQGFLYDSHWARKAKKQSTGNAGRSSYKGIPEPESTNFFIQPGTKSPEELISGITSGLYVHSMMGLHTVDTVSGDYSLGIMGERIENGRRTHGVRGITIAGNLQDLLKHVEAVGNDLTFSGSTGSPTLWIRGVSVGGS